MADTGAGDLYGTMASHGVMEMIMIKISCLKAEVPKFFLKRTSLGLELPETISKRLKKEKKYKSKVKHLKE